MQRDEMLTRVLERGNDPWDLVVVGGGATGAGVAVDAASRGFAVLLVEREDFGKGTSSRSTKLIHGGVRYLEQGNVSLVMQALEERGLLHRNAPHLVHDLAFIVPNYSWWEAPFYGIGLKIYDLLAGRYGFGKSELLSRERTLEAIPTLAPEGLRGGVLYHDGQFDDTRLLIHLLVTAADHGAAVVNYMPAVGVHRDGDGFVDGVFCQDAETGDRMEVRGRVVVNATGVFADQVRRMAEPAAQTMIAPSQGLHLVLDRSFLHGAGLEGSTAIMVPHTSDGRVMFAIPWHNHTVLGTTDTPIEELSYEPLPFEEEIDFVLETAGEYLSRKPTRADVLSAYVGIRPLVKAAGSDTGRTSALSRDHTIQIDPSGLLTIVGGKWTTYRLMAEDAVNHAILLGRLEDRPCVTRTLPIHGSGMQEDHKEPLAVYGSDAEEIRALMDAKPGWAQPLDADLPIRGAEVVWAVRHEMARRVEDVLARRTRALFLNARAAARMAPRVAELMAAELKRPGAWAEEEIRRFEELAAQYMLQRTESQV